MEGYKSLVVWKKSYELSLSIYGVTKKFPREELYALTSQLRRAASSIPVNIAEGYARGSLREYIQFLTVARGSCAELETLLLLSRDLKYLGEHEYRELENERNEVTRILQGLINSLKRNLPDY